MAQVQLFRAGDSVETYLADLSSVLSGSQALTNLLNGVSTQSTQYFVAPRLTTVERDALSATTGMIVYNTTTGAYNVYTTAWKVVTVT